MPPRPSHIPHSNERSALQRMSVAKGLSSEELHPAGKQAIASMAAKGWIERGSNESGAADLFHYCGRTSGLEGAHTGQKLTVRAVNRKDEEQRPDVRHTETSWALILQRTLANRAGQNVGP
jgi:hypothetical protein